MFGILSEVLPTVRSIDFKVSCYKMIMFYFDSKRQKFNITSIGSRGLIYENRNQNFLAYLAQEVWASKNSLFSVSHFLTSPKVYFSIWQLRSQMYWIKYLWNASESPMSDLSLSFHRNDGLTRIPPLDIISKLFLSINSKQFMNSTNFLNKIKNLSFHVHFKSKFRKKLVICLKTS